MTHVSTSIFQGILKNIVFRSVALVTKLWAILDFFLHSPNFSPPCILCIKKKVLNNSFNFLYIKIHKILQNFDPGRKRMQNFDPGRKHMQVLILAENMCKKSNQKQTSFLDRFHIFFGLKKQTLTE